MKTHHPLAVIVLSLLISNTAIQAKTERSTSASKSLIEKTAIIIPRVVKDYQLVSFEYDKKYKFSGVQMRYVSSRHPDIPIDFFIYPMGTGPVKKMLTSGMQDFTDSLRQAEEMGYFEKLVLSSEQDLILDDEKIRVLTADTAPLENTASKTETPEENAVLAAIEASFDLPGKKLGITHVQKNSAKQSVGYLFYRQLYLTKVRVTIEAAALSSEEFSNMTDAAVAQIVPAIEARNIGSCSDRKISVTINESKKKAAFSDDLMQQIIAGHTQNAADNCVTDLALGKIATSAFEVVTIEYTPEDWGN